ncbi:hypothetical protein [Clostridium sp. ZS2-4]|nr:hypothetical protein [Clostridium sp. ZS2-4]MCY6354744.1 hypothetical protein [Clostridium sp. ZS2-4]
MTLTDIKEESKKEKVIESNISLMSSSKKDISLKSNVQLEKIIP